MCAPLKLVEPDSPLPNMREVVATHESAHCLVARALGFELGGVTIQPAGDYAGMIWPSGRSPSKSYEEINRSVTALCESAKALMTPLGMSRQWAGDWVISARGETMVAVAGHLGECIRFGREITPQYGTDGSIARAYASTVVYSPEAVQAFIRYCEVECETILQRYWHSVEMVAAALLAHGTLNSEQIDEAIATGVALTEAERERDRRRVEMARVERAKRFIATR